MDLLELFTEKCVILLFARPVFPNLCFSLIWMESNSFQFIRLSIWPSPEYIVPYNFI